METSMEVLQSALRQLQQSLAGGEASCHPQIEQIRLIIEDIRKKHSDVVQALENKYVMTCSALKTCLVSACDEIYGCRPRNTHETRVDC